MSPEQAKGRQIDRRSDIWAFGCVLFEMLTGKMAFGGESVTDTLTEILKAEPNWSRLPANTPLPIRALLQRCLKKDLRQRLQAIGEARIVIEAVLTGGTGVDDNHANVSTTQKSRPVVWNTRICRRRRAGCSLRVVDCPLQFNTSHDAFQRSNQLCRCAGSAGALARWPFRGIHLES
jgi:serine/threonine protein kinase